MPVFNSTDELYAVMDSLFERIAADQQITTSLLEARMVVCFKWTEPEGEATIDLRQPPLTYTFGPTDLKPDVVMLQSADVAHQFWIGNLNVPQAVATRKVIAQGSVPKALKLLPSIQPAFAIYKEVLADLGHDDLLVSEKVRIQRKKRRGFWQRFRQPSTPELPDSTMLNRHYIPLQEGEVTYAFPQPTASQLPADENGFKLEMLRRMMLIRAFEEHLKRAFANGELPTQAIHLAIGQEATAVGTCFALRPDDLMASTHRGHGHMLAKGADLNGMMAEIYGKVTGLCKGKGGSMHVTDARVGAIGANGIVGASFVLAPGAGLASHFQGTDRVCVAFCGDGATNQGMFHEGINFAAVFDLPVLFVVENNQYGEFTPLAEHTRVEKLADRAQAYGIPGVQVDGNDVWAVYEAVLQAIKRARQGEGPTLLELVTYRWQGHMEGDDAAYRPEGELETWQQRDPIDRWQAVLLQDDIITATQLDDLRQEITASVSQAAALAQEASPPDLNELTVDVYAPESIALFQSTTLPVPSRQVSYSEALWEAICEEMARDPSVILFGEDVTAGGYFAVTRGIHEEFTGRVLDTPISEYAIGGAAVGAAVAGLRPVAEILFSDFLTTVMDPIVNQAAKLRYMSGGQYAVPMVVRTPGGAGLGMAAQHSQSLEALLTGIPGLIIMAPSTPLDAKGMLKAAIRSNNPVLFFENKLLYLTTGQIPDEEYLIPIGVADIKRTGHDVTVVAIGGKVPQTLEVADALAREGIEVEVVDPRTLVPLDMASIAYSVQKTGKLVIVEEGHLTHGFGSEIAARIVEIAPGLLKAPIKRVAAVDAPLAYAGNLEQAAVPDDEAIRNAILSALDS